MITQTTDYTSGANFSYNPAVIAFPGLVAQLNTVIAAGAPYAQSFASSAGFTYNPATAVFTGGAVTQVDQRTDKTATFGALLSGSVNGNWGSGILTGTVTGANSFSGGKLALGNAGQVRWADPTGLQTGAIKALFTPAYSGYPSSDQLLMSSAQTPGSFQQAGINSISLIHQASGNLSLIIYNAGGYGLGAAVLFSWSPTAGTEYEIELDFDFTVGAQRVFLNGSQVGTTQTISFTRTASAYLQVGTALANEQFSVRNVEAFAAVQHTANYTPGYTVPATIYAETNITCPTTSYTAPEIGLFLTAASSTESGTPGYTMNSQWFNGSAIVASNGTYAQSNTKAQILALIAALAPTGIPLTSSSITVNVILPAGNSPASVTVLGFSVSGYLYPTGAQYIELASPIRTDDLVSAAAAFSAPTNTEVGFYLSVNGTPMWWNGSAWVASNQTIAQSNTTADITTNAPALAAQLTGGANINLGVLLQSLDQQTTPTITSQTLAYNFRAPVSVPPYVCSVWTYLYNILGTAIGNGSASGAQLTVTLNQGFKVGEEIVGPWAQAFSFDDTGYVEVSLAASTGTPYNFAITYTDASRTKRTVNFVPSAVPTQAEISLMDLTTIEPAST